MTTISTKLVCATLVCSCQRTVGVVRLSPRVDGVDVGNDVARGKLSKEGEHSANQRTLQFRVFETRLNLGTHANHQGQ